MLKFHTATNKKNKTPLKSPELNGVLCAVILSANATEVARVTFSLYRIYGIQSERKYLIRTHIREHRTIVSRI